MTWYVWLMLGAFALLMVTWLICGTDFTKRQLGKVWAAIRARFRRT